MDSHPVNMDSDSDMSRSSSRRLSSGGRYSFADLCLEENWGSEASFHSQNNGRSLLRLCKNELYNPARFLILCAQLTQFKSCCVDERLSFCFAEIQYDV